MSSFFGFWNQLILKVVQKQQIQVRTDLLRKMSFADSLASRVKRDHRWNLMIEANVTHLETKYQTELDNLEELRQSILEQAFEGKLTEPVAA